MLFFVIIEICLFVCLFCVFGVLLIHIFLSNRQMCVKMFYYVTRSVYVSSSCHLFDGGPHFLIIIIFIVFVYKHYSLAASR